MKGFKLKLICTVASLKKVVKLGNQSKKLPSMIVRAKPEWMFIILIMDHLSEFFCSS